MQALIDIDIRVDLEEAQRLLTPEQVAALMAGIALVLNAQRQRT